MIERGGDLTLEIDKPAAGGRMLARHAGQVVLVTGTIPGERVVARVERLGKGVAFADTVDVLVASPDRRPGSTDWRCGGDAFSHIAYPRQRALKAQIIQDAFARIGRLPLGAAPEIIASPEQGYRMRARLHVQGGRIGFFREGTHDICDASVSRQMLPATIEWIASAAGVLRRLSETMGARETAVASLELCENAAGSQRAIHLDLHAGVNPAVFTPLAEELVGLSARPADARAPSVLSGSPAIEDDVEVRGGNRLTLRRDVRAFFQANRFLLKPLVQHVLARVESGPVVDLYAGVGLFGLSLAAAGVHDVTLVEGDPISGADLVRNADPFADRVIVRRQSVETFLAGLADPQRWSASGPVGQRDHDRVFIVDPPRTGMTREALGGIINQEPSRIVYVSCDVATLARDARTLLDAGWELAEITGIDLFPNTAHVESIAVFERRG
jgi:23S rRNA (uracil1939-C5)-methyltransferase